MAVDPLDLIPQSLALDAELHAVQLVRVAKDDHDTKMSVIGTIGVKLGNVEAFGERLIAQLKDSGIAPSAITYYGHRLWGKRKKDGFGITFKLGGAEYRLYASRYVWLETPYRPERMIDAWITEIGKQ